MTRIEKYLRSLGFAPDEDRYGPTDNLAAKGCTVTVCLDDLPRLTIDVDVPGRGGFAGDLSEPITNMDRFRLAPRPA
jgi:hypothetical protein